MENARTSKEYDFDIVRVRVTDIPCEQRDGQPLSFTGVTMQRVDALVALTILTLPKELLSPRMIMFVRERTRMAPHDLAREIEVLPKFLHALERVGAWEEVDYGVWKDVVSDRLRILAECRGASEKTPRVIERDGIRTLTVSCLDTS